MNETVLSVVVPAYNEESVLTEFYRRLKVTMDQMGLPYEIVFVDDGSKDATPDILKKIAQDDPRVRVYIFTKNFGHQIALKAGFDHCRGEAVITLDADLQDQPELIPDLVKAWQNGAKVVYAKRTLRLGETQFKKITSSVYYWLLQKMSPVRIPRDVGDFRLVSVEVADIIRASKNKNPYLRGLVAWTRLKSETVPYQRDPRYAGETKYSMKKMLHLAWSGFINYSFLEPVFRRAQRTNEPLYALKYGSGAKITN